MGSAWPTLFSPFSDRILRKQALAEYRRNDREFRLASLCVFVNLAARIDGENVDHSGFAVHREQDAPSADARLADTMALGQRR